MSSTESGPEAGTDLIAAAFRRLEEGVVAKATETAVKFSFQLSGPELEPDEKTRLDEMLLHLSELFTNGFEFIGVERQRGSWCLTYRHDRGLVGGVPVLLRDASFDVRRRFVERAGPFVEAYRAEIERALADRNQRVDRAQTVAAEADAALARLSLDREA